MGYASLVKAGFRWFLDFVLPPLCLKCDSPVGENGTLCPDCWKQIQFSNKPWCQTCGIPFDLPVDEGTLCAHCLAEPPLFSQARSAMIYDEGSRDLVLMFKHADRLHSVPTFARWMLRAGSECTANCDVVIPIPLHRWRLLARRYNQSALLALELSKLLNRPVLLDTLTRTRHTPSQGHMNRKERRKNVHNAFAVQRPDMINGKTVLLIDDVMTTGATIESATAALLKAGAKSVSVLTLARVRMIAQ